MSRPSRRKAHLSRARELKIQPQIKVAEPVNYVFACIASGVSAMNSFIFMLLNNIMIPSATAFYRAQKRVCSIIYQLALDVVNGARTNMKNNTCISFDGSWSHRRNAMFCIVDFIDQTQKKIVDFSIKVKNIKGISNYSGPSNMMESNALEELLIRWRNSDDAKKVTLYCHDRDCKAKKIVSRIMPNWQERNDPNHVSHTLNTLFKKHNGKENLLFGLKGKLMKLWNVLNKRYDNVEERQNIWKNAPNHYCGTHTNCHHSPWDEKKILKKRWKKADNENCKKALERFIEDTIGLFHKIEKNCNTQLCESFHSIKARFVSKTIAWGYSWIGRVAASILQFNVPGCWVFEARRRLGLPSLNLKVEKRLCQIFKHKKDKKEKNKQVQSIEKRKEYRNRKKWGCVIDSKLEKETKHK